MSILAIALNPTIDVSSRVDKVVPTKKLRTFDQQRHPGGGGVNVARVIATLGGRAELLYLSGGAAGALLDDALNALPIDLHRIAIAGPTRIAFMVHEESTGLEYRFVPEGPEVSPAETAAALSVVSAFRGDYVIASGGLPRGMPEDIYAQMARIAAANGARFILDTSGPALASALDGAPVFLVKPGLDELEMLVGRKLAEGDIAEVARSLVASGRSRHVLVSLGREGSLLASPDGLTRLPAIHVIVQSAVGAGDSMVGALALKLDQGASMAEAFRHGTAAGTAAVMTPGTELCRRADVEAILRQLDAAVPAS